MSSSASKGEEALQDPWTIKVGYSVPVPDGSSGLHPTVHKSGEVFSITDLPSTSVTVRIDVPDGWRLERAFPLYPGRLVHPVVLSFAPPDPIHQEYATLEAVDEYQHLWSRAKGAVKGVRTSNLTDIAALTLKSSIVDWWNWSSEIYETALPTPFDESECDFKERWAEEGLSIAEGAFRKLAETLKLSRTDPSADTFQRTVIDSHLNQVSDAIKSWRALALFAHHLQCQTGIHRDELLRTKMGPSAENSFVGIVVQVLKRPLPSYLVDGWKTCGLDL